MTEAISNPTETQLPGDQQMPRGKKSNGQSAANGVGDNKMEAVRRALGTLGRRAKPKAIHSHIMETYHLDVHPNMISSYKSTILKGGGGKGKKRGPKPKSNGARGHNIISDLKALKEMKARLGADGVQELLGLLA
jgi:hypothetical protein